MNSDPDADNQNTDENDGATVNACPYCNSSNVHRRTRKRTYYCNDCLEECDEHEVVERPREETHIADVGRRKSESVRALLDADPDEVLS